MFKIGFLTFHLYGLLIGLGIWAAIEMSLWLASKRKILKQVQDDRWFYQLSWWTIPPGIIGARIYHVIDYWQRYYSLQPIKVFYVWEGGLGIWGGIIGGLVGLLGYYYFVALTPGESIRSPHGRVTSFFELLDIIFIGLPLGQAIGRWGNYFNNELVGRNGHPLFLYESILDLGLFGVLVMIASTPLSLRDIPSTTPPALRATSSNLEEETSGNLFLLGKTGGKRQIKSGVISGAYLIGYGLIRYASEFLRPEEMVWKINGLPVAQLFSIMAIVGGIWIIRTPRGRNNLKG